MRSILLSEGFPWPPHYEYSGKRDIDTYAAICIWDGKELTKDEKAIVELSEQSPVEHEFTKRLVQKRLIPERLKTRWRYDMERRRHKILRLSRQGN